MARDQGQDSARFQGIEGLCQEEIVQGETLPAIREADVGEGHIADDGVDAALGQEGIAEVFDADVLIRMKGPGDAPREAVQLDADKTHGRRGQADEVANAAARLQDGGILRHAQAHQGRMHRLDNGRRGIEGRKGSAFGAGIVFGGQ
jgi:hypothetical protein